MCFMIKYSFSIQNIYSRKCLEIEYYFSKFFFLVLGSLSKKVEFFNLETPSMIKKNRRIEAEFFIFIIWSAFDEVKPVDIIRVFKIT